MNQPHDVESATSVGVRIDHLTISTPQQVLLKETSVDLLPGEITLLVGASGSGKTVLLRLLAGLLSEGQTDISVNGSIAFVSASGAPIETPAVGVVFQSLAIFDELSVTDNVRLGADHGRRSTQSSFDKSTNLLDELGVPKQTPASLLSGGQRQRLAIARVLAQDPDLILYDEPTSGLDGPMAERVGRLIESTQKKHRKTCLVVTHDFDPLIPIADRILLLDGGLQQIVEIDRADWPRLNQLLAESVQRSRSIDRSVPKGSKGSRIAEVASNFFSTTSRFAEEICLLPVRLLPIWKSLRWGVSYLFYYMRLVAGLSAWVYIALAGAIVGYVATYFTFRYMPYAKYTEPLFLENLLASIGFALYRILIPVFATILIAARSGAAVASDIGGKVYGKQRDVLVTLGVKPTRYLLTGTVWAFLVGTPVLVALAYWVASVTSLFVFTWMRPEHGPEYWGHYYHSALKVDNGWIFDGFKWWLAKTTLCGLGTAEIAYHLGASPKGSTREVSQAITRTVLVATIYVLLVHFAFAFVEFE
jgi:ABC-type transporter Mla maintaining outer membrane lipid asymmetry ATPase subunit MlaF/ABC-type transporter Mla maintaining outer membrane lipid asymmetry permease subunit MlaE